MTVPEPITLDEGKIQFYDFYRTALSGGENYVLHVEQEVDLSAIEDRVADAKTDGDPDIKRFRTEQTFHAFAPHFGLGPADVHAAYPPGNSVGNFGSTLPHVVLRRRTLPWERELSGSTVDQPVPWLALLLFHADDDSGDNVANSLGPPPRVLRTLDEIFNKPEDTNIIGFHDLGLKPEPIDDLNSKAHTIDIPTWLFHHIAPRAEELPLLTHVRQVNTGDKELLGLQEDGWFSVVVGNRLPKPDQLNTAHLVSLYGWQDKLKKWRGGQNLRKKRYRVVSLASWSFTALDDDGRGNFKELMGQMASHTSPLQVALTAQQNAKLAQAATQDGPHQEAATLLTEALASGYVPLTYETRLGEKTAGWYRGPLLPQRVERVDKDPYESAEATLIYDPRTGLFDASYAVAWQIGRLLALSDASFAAALQRWRQEGHRLLDQVLEQVGIGDRFTDAHLSTLLGRIKAATNELEDSAASDEHHQALQNLLQFFIKEVQTPQQLSERLFNGPITELLNKLILDPDPAASLTVASVKKPALTAKLPSLTKTDLAAIDDYAPGLARAKLIRDQLKAKNGPGEAGP